MADKGVLSRTEAPAERGDARSSGACDTYLIADSRERAVIPFLEEALREHALVVRQVTTADYLVCTRGARRGDGVVVRAAFERKTLEDFAASFKDARYENLKKMLSLRERTGCQLFFVVEGPAFPSPARRFARIPYASILAAITKLMVRDGVFVVQTEDEAHSARRLADLVRAYAAVPAVAHPCTALSGDAVVSEAVTSEAVASDDFAGDDFSVPEILTERIDKTEAETVTGMWMQLRGISVVLGRILSQKFSVADLVVGRVQEETIRALRTATGRVINKDAVKSLLLLRGGSRELASKLIAGIPGVSAAVAEIVIDAAGGLGALCRMPDNALAELSIPQKNRTVRFGPARAAKLSAMLNWVEGAAPSEAKTGARVAASRAASVAAGGSASGNLPLEAEAPPLSAKDIDEIFDSLWA